MPLDPDYLDYPHRRYGMDQPRYDWRPLPKASQRAWSNGAAVAVSVVVPLEFHRLDPTGKPFRHPGAMVTPYPDLRHFTTRDYGLRVGVFRILDALAAAGVKATFPVNASLLTRVEPLVRAILAEGHEIAAYGLDADNIHWSGLEDGVEARWVAETRRAFSEAGLEPRTWMSPARQQSFQTLDLIAAEKFDVCLDWEQDTAPVTMATSSSTVVAVPLSNELDDRLLLIDRKQTEDSWAAQILEAVRFLIEESGSSGSRSLAFTLTPYVIGQPFRAAVLSQLLRQLASLRAAWFAPAASVAADTGVGPEG